MRSLEIRILNENRVLYFCKGTFNDKYLSFNTKISWIEENTYGREDIRMINPIKTQNLKEAYECIIGKAEYMKNTGGQVTPEDFQYKIITEIK